MEDLAPIPTAGCPDIAGRKHMFKELLIDVPRHELSCFSSEQDS